MLPAMLCRLPLVFFFSSRRRHTRWNCDWSSDVCSSDLRDLVLRRAAIRDRAVRRHHRAQEGRGGAARGARGAEALERSEERRVGKECRSRGGREQYKKKKNRAGGSVVHIGERQTVR